MAVNGQHWSPARTINSSKWYASSTDRIRSADESEYGKIEISDRFDGCRGRMAWAERRTGMGGPQLAHYWLEMPPRHPSWAGTCPKSYAHVNNGEFFMAK